MNKYDETRIKYHEKAEWHNKTIPGMVGVKSIIRYLKSKRHCMTFFYHPNGNFKQITRYYRGKKHGMDTTFNEDGSIESKTKYVQGVNYEKDYK
jgi:antitoxin component YwqK of YwqJK toxin-antitoxin module